MTKCQVCEQEMTTASSCVVIPLKINGELTARIPHFGEDRCGDCAVLPGGLHHPGCDCEDCPSCGEQFAFCDCEVE